jgi:flagellar protein FlbD
MIKITRLNGTAYVLNCDIIETIESTPDTVITTVYGRKYVCAESVYDVIEKIIEYKGRISQASQIQMMKGD